MRSVSDNNMTTKEEEDANDDRSAIDFFLLLFLILDRHSVTLVVHSESLDLGTGWGGVDGCKGQPTYSGGKERRGEGRSVFNDWRKKERERARKMREGRTEGRKEGSKDGCRNQTGHSTGISREKKGKERVKE